MSENYCFCFLVSTFFKTGEEIRDESALRCSHDQGSAEVGFQNIGKDNAENQRCRFKSVDFHKVSDETEHEHDDNFVHAVTQCISTDAG